MVPGLNPGLLEFVRRFLFKKDLATSSFVQFPIAIFPWNKTLNNSFMFNSCFILISCGCVAGACYRNSMYEPPPKNAAWWIA